jgi:DNA-binding PadR family transcriptional regulator
MEKKGLVTSKWNERTGKEDRRIYQITQKGENLLKTRFKMMKERLRLLKQMVSYRNNNFAEKRE